MSTRGAVCLVVNGDEKTIYNHNDSYPEGLGRDVLGWLRGVLADEQAASAAVAALRLVPSGDPTPEDFERLAEFHDRYVDNGKSWYSLLRRTQGDLAATLQAGLYEPAHEFPRNSRVCTWAYVVDFDERRFEVYKGFRREPTTEGRWAGQAGDSDSGPRFFPVQRIAAFGFDELPEDLAAAVHRALAVAVLNPAEADEHAGVSSS